MEDTFLPPTQSTQSNDPPTALDGAGANAPVSSYSLPPKQYPIETLEVHKEGERVGPATPFAPTLRSVPFSRRRALTVSLGITLAIVLITGLVSAFFLNRRQPESSSSQVPTQDVSFGEEAETAPAELQGSENALLVNGDLVTRGKLKVVADDFVLTMGTQDLTANRTITLPDASGEICLDGNNCNFATQGQVTQLTQTVAGVDILNTLLGTGPLRAAVGGLVVGTINLGSTDVAGTLLVPNGGTGVTALVANGVLIGNGTGPIGAAVATTSGQCLVSTGGAPVFQTCPGAGSTNFSLNGQTGAVTLQGTANQINVATGAGVITLSTLQDIAPTSDVTFDALELTGLLHSTNSIDIDVRGVVGNGNTLVSPQIDTRNTLTVTETFNVDCSFGCSGIHSVVEFGSATTPFFLSAYTGSVKVGDGRFLSGAVGINVTSTILGTGASLTENYGVFVHTQTAGVTDYGVYIQGADTYALWVDSGISRFDGVLEFEGATDNGFETTLTVADPSADNTIILPNASGTVCLQNSVACGFATGSGNAYVNGGNNFGGTGTLGLTSSNDLNIITNNVTRLSVQADGDVAFDTNTLFVDAANNRVGINDGAPSEALDVGGNGIFSGRLSVGNASFISSIMGLHVDERYDSADSCGLGCFGAFVTARANNPTNPTDLIGVYSSVATDSAFTLNNAAAFSAANPAITGGTSITNNFGLFVANQMAGVNDYGVYVQGAETYGLWIDSGASRFDGTVEVQTLGTADTANYLCRNSSNQLAACNTTGAGAAFVQGGNSFATAAVLGTNDANPLELETEGITRLTINDTADGGGVGIGGIADVAVKLRVTDVATDDSGKYLNSFDKTVNVTSGNTVTSVHFLTNNLYNGSIAAGGTLRFPGGGGPIRLNESTFDFDLNGAGAAVDATVQGYNAQLILGGSGGGTMDEYMGYYVATPNVAATNTVTSVYGLYVDSLDSASITNAYGIYQAGVNDLNYFGGNVGINNTSAPNRVSLNTLTTADSAAQLAVSTGAVTNKGVIVQGVASQSADLFQAQSSTGTVLASISSAGHLTVQNATVNGALTVNGHIITANSSGSTTVAAGTAANCSGTGSTNISGNDTAGTITITTGAGPCAAGTLATITFANAFGTSPRVVLTPKDANGATLQYYNGTTNTTTFTIDTGTAANGATTYTYNYHVMQ